MRKWKPKGHAAFLFQIASVLVFGPEIEKDVSPYGFIRIAA